MSKMVAVFQTQFGAEQAVNEITSMGWDDVETAVYEGRSQDSPTGADTIPNTGTMTVLPAPTGTSGGIPAFVPFHGLQLDFLNREEREFFRNFYDNGATLVVVDGPEEKLNNLRTVLSGHGGRFAQKD